jgi:hypothetical protein
MGQFNQVFHYAETVEDLQRLIGAKVCSPGQDRSAGIITKISPPRTIPGAVLTMYGTKYNSIATIAKANGKTRTARLCYLWDLEDVVARHKKEYDRYNDALKDLGYINAPVV